MLLWLNVLQSTATLIIGGYYNRKGRFNCVFKLGVIVGCPHTFSRIVYVYKKIFSEMNRIESIDFISYNELAQLIS